MIYYRQILNPRPTIFEISDRIVEIIFNLICINYLLGQSKFSDTQAVARWIAEITSF